MYKVRIDLIARRSVVIALNDADGASDAYEKAEAKRDKEQASAPKTYKYKRYEKK